MTLITPTRSIVAEQITLIIPPNVLDDLMTLIILTRYDLSDLMISITPGQVCGQTLKTADASTTAPTAFLTTSAACQEICGTM